MGIWDWVLVGLCAAGLLAVLAGAGAAALAAIALARRAAELRSTPVIQAMQTAPLTAERFEHTIAQARTLPERMLAAIENLKRAPSIAGFGVVRSAWASFLGEYRALVDELR